MPSNHLILSHPLLLLTSIFPSIRVFSNELTLLMRWPKCWSFSFSISPSNQHPGLISFRMDWLDLLAVQGTLKSLLQQHGSKASILQCSAFFTVQLSHPHVTTGKTIALRLSDILETSVVPCSHFMDCLSYISWITCSCWFPSHFDVTEAAFLKPREPASADFKLFFCCFFISLSLHRI